MNNSTPHNPGMLDHPHQGNGLWQYVQSLDPETIARLSQPSPEVIQMMEGNITGMLGSLPPEHFDVTITTNREQLGRLLASAMMSGYFLNRVEQRMKFDYCLTATEEEARA
ncbi:DUF760 domain-containing protein [Spirulina subsalsa]